MQNLHTYTRQTRKIGPALARLRVHWPNIVPYMGMHWANFPGLSGYLLCAKLDTIYEMIVCASEILKHQTWRRAMASPVDSTIGNFSLESL